MEASTTSAGEGITDSAAQDVIGHAGVPAGAHCQPQADPLAALRTPDDPPWDVYLTGTVFLDIIFTGLDSAPVRGTESWARGMGSSPGGVANMATALARLGLRTWPCAAAFGTTTSLTGRVLPGRRCRASGDGHRPLTRLAAPCHG
ncbi:hypothetical protein SHIRM173S_05115 [Streptomyces hirsutus]